MDGHRTCSPFWLRHASDHTRRLPLPEASAPSSYHAVYDELPAAPSLSQLLAGANRAGIGWSDRVDVFVALEAAVQGAGPAAAADVASNAERLVAALLDGAGDAHFKVAGAALQALGAGLAGPSSRVFEPHLDRIVPALFARVCDGKEQVRVLAAAALAALPSRHAPDAVVTALAKALAAVKAPRLRCAVMDHFSSAAGDPALRQLLCAQGSGLRALVAGAVQLARDKNPDIRRSALRLLATAYKAADADVVVAALGGLPQTAAEALHKPLLAAIEVLDLSALEAGQGQQQQQQQGEDEGPARAGTKDRTAAASAAAASMTECTEAQHSRAGAAAADASSSPAGGALEPATAATSAPAASEMPAQTPPPPSPFVWTAGPASLAATSAALKPERRPQSEQPPIPVPPGQQQQQQQPAPPLDAVMEGQLRRLLGQLQSGPRAFEVLQGLSRLVPALPASAWAAHFNQILAAAFVGLDSGSGPLEEAAALLVRDLAAALPPALFEPATPALLPRLLACAARAEAREVAVAADEALDALLRRVDPEPCLALLAPRLPAESVPQPTEASLMEPQRAAVRSLRRVLLRLPPPAVVARLDSLVPSLRAAYGSQFTEMRKAVVDCLVAVCLAVGKAAAEPHLAPLSASQRRLLDVYVQRAADAGRHTETP